MSFTVNTVIIGGHLGAPPEDKRTASGKLLCSFRLATNRWDAKSEEEVTDWHTVIAWDKQAEQCIKYLSKGSAVLVEGRLAVRHFDDAEGKKQTRYEIVAGRVYFLGKGAARDAAGSTAQAPEPKPLVREVKGFSVDSIPF